MTKAQSAILQVVRKHKHLSADNIYKEVKKEIPNIALGTVYRNLNMFAENKIICRVSRSNKPDIFDSNTDAHGHIVCIKCGKTDDLNLQELKKLLNVHVKTEIYSIELSAYYICLDCSEI